MTDILLLLVLLIVVLAALYLVAVRPDLVAAWAHRLLRDPDPWGWQAGLRARLLAVKRPPVDPWYPTDIAEAEARYGDPYPPEAAEAPDREPRCSLRPDPVDEHFNATTAGSIYVKSDHPEDCAKQCCWEIRLNELVADFDWDAREHEMRSKR